MNKTDEITKTKPFHESIVDAINNCSFPGHFYLARLIKITTIPKNHDAIVSAWQKRMKLIGSDDCGITESVLKQKIGTEICVISLETFKSLEQGEKIKDVWNKEWTVDLASCGGPGKFPTHFLRSPQDELEYVFHDGEYMRFCREEDKELDGAKVGDFIKRWQPA